MSHYKHGRVMPTCPYILVHPLLAARYLTEGRSLVCVVRHGQTDWNIIKRLQGRENVPLNDTGRAQAHSAAAVFKSIKDLGVSFGTVFSSPLDRAKETASIIAQAIGADEVVPLDGLIERDYGSLSGLTLEERRRRFPKGERHASDVESSPSAALRMLSAIDEMLEYSGGKTVIGVTHGGVLNAVYSRLTSGEIGLTVNCSLSLIAAGVGEPIPLAYNLQGEGASKYISKLLRHGAKL